VAVAKEAPKEPFVEMANHGLRRKGGMQVDEYLPELRGQRAAQVYREMLTDPIVGAVLFSIDATLRAVEWDVEPASGAPADVERAEFLRSCLDDMSHTWPAFISNVLTFLPFGFSVFEQVYKRRQGPAQSDPTKRSKYDDGLIGWRKHSLLPQHTISCFDYDDHGGIQSVKQQASGLGTVEIPIAKLLLFRTNDRSAMGESVLRTAYKPHYFKKKIEAIEAIGIERDLAGLPVIYCDADYLARNYSELQHIVRNLRRDEQEGVLLPHLPDDSGNRSIELTLLTSGGARQFDTDKVVARHSRAIAMSLLQDVLLLGHERVGTQALAVEKRDLSDVALGAWLGEIEAVLNDVAVPRLFELNGFDLANLPRLTYGEIRPPDAAAFTEAVVAAAGAGLLDGGDPTVNALVRRRLGFPPAEEGTEAPPATEPTAPVGKSEVSEIVRDDFGQIVGVIRRDVLAREVGAVVEAARVKQTAETPTHAVRATALSGAATEIVRETVLLGAAGGDVEKHRVTVTIDTSDEDDEANTSDEELPATDEFGMPRSQSIIGPLDMPTLYPAADGIKPAVNKEAPE
jgi:hypothetical protein